MSRSQDATAEVSREGDSARVRLTGALRVAAIDRLRAELAPLEGARHLTVDLGGVEAMDTAGAWLVARLGPPERVEVRGATDLQARLIDTVRENLPEEPQEARPGPWPMRMLAGLGRWSAAAGAGFVAGMGFLGLTLARTGGLILRPGRMRLTSLVHHVQAVGLEAVAIVSVMAFLIGVVLAFQGAAQLRQFGAEVFVVDLIAISILRELGVLMTAIIIAGRSGSAFTAQIGTMKVNQEVDAMQTLGLDPVDILVLPRVLALAVTLPLLAFYASMVALLGGAVMAYFTLNITFGQFLMQFQSAVAIEHFWIGMVKAPVFAFVIAMVGCYEGLKVTGSAESVGRLTTQAVVEAIFLVIVIDALFSILFANVGL